MTILANRTNRARVGVFGIGLAAYWPQFEGLRDLLVGYQQEVERRITAMGAEVVSAGLVDTAPAAQDAGDRFAANNVDLIVCYVGTYSTSSQVLPAVQRRKAPVLVLNLQPVPSHGLPQHRHGGVAGQLLRLLRAGDLQRLCAQPHPVQCRLRAAFPGPGQRRTATTSAAGARSRSGSRPPASCAS